MYIKNHISKNIDLPFIALFTSAMLDFPIASHSVPFKAIGSYSGYSNYIGLCYTMECYTHYLEIYLELYSS